MKYTSDDKRALDEIALEMFDRIYDKLNAEEKETVREYFEEHIL